MAIKPPLMEALFVVSGMDFDPHLCSSAFGLEPTSVRIKGDPTIKKGPPVSTSEWSIATKWSKCYSTDSALQSLLDRIWGRRVALRNSITTSKLSVTFLVYIRGGIGTRNVLYELSRPTIKRIAYFGGEIFFDVY